MTNIEKAQEYLNNLEAEMDVAMDKLKSLPGEAFSPWDWQLRGKLTESEYKAYKACDWVFGWRDDKYLPTEEQIQDMVDETSIDKDVLRSMYNKLTEEVR